MVYSLATNRSTDLTKEMVELKRQILLSLIINDYQEEVVIKRLMNNNLLDLISIIPHSSVITGSNALRLYGLLDRGSLDLDVISDEQSYLEFIESSGYKSDDSNYAGHTEEDVVTAYNNLNKIDFFVKDNYTDYNDFHWGKVDKIGNIIEHKAKMGRVKDYNDLKYILDKINGNTK